MLEMTKVMNILPELWTTILPFLPRQCVPRSVGVQGSNLDPLLPLKPGLGLGEGWGRLGGRGFFHLFVLRPPVQAVLALQGPDV